MIDAIDTEIKNNSRIYRSVPTTEMVTDNTLSAITKWKYIWKNGGGSNTVCDFSEFKKYSTNEHIRFLISKFQQFGGRDATQCTRFWYVSEVLRHAWSAHDGKEKVEFSSETCTQYIHAIYLSMTSTGVGLHGKPINATTLGDLASRLNTLCKKLGFREIPKAARNIATRSASLESDNYTVKELRSIAFSLLEDRKCLLKRYKDESLTQYQRNLAFDKLTYNAVFLTIYYLGTGLTETLNMFLEDEWICKNSGAGRISIEGLKTRGYTVEHRVFTPRASCKKFFDSLIELSKCHSTSLSLDKHLLFRKLNGDTPKVNNLTLYATGHLLKQSKRLQVLAEKKPQFRLSCNRLKSSVKQYAERQLGRNQAAENTRNAPNTYDKSNYGKVTKNEAREQLAFGLTALHHLGENPSGGAIFAVAKAKELAGYVITHEEWQEIKSASATKEKVLPIKNGGFCKGNDTPQKKEFHKIIDRTELLTKKERSKLGCGFIIKCFSCANFGVVDNAHDIWRLLSFEKRLNDAMAMHQSVEHFITNFGEVKSGISKIKEQFKKAHLKAAMKLLERECHPLWDESSVMDIFRG